MLFSMEQAKSTLAALLSMMLASFAANAGPPNAAIPSATEGNDEHLQLPQAGLIYFPYADARRDGNTAQNGAFQSYVPLSRPLLSIGNFEIRLGNNESGAHFAHYDLGTPVLGGRVTGTLDGAKGSLRLSWPTEN